MALYNIRALVGTANAASGINTALAKAAFIDKRIGQLEQFANGSEMISLDVIKGKAWLKPSLGNNIIRPVTTSKPRNLKDLPYSVN
jgi:hypothetical protein